MSADGAVQDDFFQELLGDFLDESSQLLNRLNEHLLALDDWLRNRSDSAARYDDEPMNDMFRAAHSLKGLSAMLGLEQVNQLTHKVENVFDAARKDELPVTPEVVELLFQACDRLVAMIDHLKQPEGDAVDASGVADEIARLLAAAGAERRQSTQADAERLCLEATAEPSTAPESTDPHQRDILSDIVDETEISEKYLAIFIDETEQSLDELTEILLALEHRQDPAGIDRLLVAAHRIKGSAASLGLRRAARLAHLMEDHLQGLRESHRPVSRVLADSFLQCGDGLRAYLDGLRAGAPSTAGLGPLCAMLNDLKPLIPVDAEHTAMPDGRSTTVAELATRLAAIAPQGRESIAGWVRFAPNLPLVGLKAELILEKLSQLGSVFHCDPPPGEFEGDRLEFLSFGLATESDRQTVERHLRIAGIEGIETLGIESAPEVARTAFPAVTIPGRAEPLASGAAQAAAIGSATTTLEAQRPLGEPDQAARKPTETLRVDVDRLESLMKLAGQLAINKARFSRIADSLKQALVGKRATARLDQATDLLERIARLANLPTDKEGGRAELESLALQARTTLAELSAVRRDVSQLASLRTKVNELAEAVHQLDRVTDAIQRGVMGTRMVPIGPLFGRFRRVVRDITRANGKEIQLAIGGEKTELDKRMIDELGDPLIHMIRNSADHGIETPEARRVAGKPPVGTISLNAFHRGNCIVIQVRDDGRGLDPDRIRAKAVERRLVSTADAERLTREDTLRLIWAPGFTTADKVTEISGRGMGMDIVRSKIEALSGEVELDSTPGQGTTFTIRLPLTLAILPSLMTQVGRAVFALPIESVREIVRVRPADLATVHGRRTACVRGGIISVAQLNDVFGEDVVDRAIDADREGLTLVILVGDGRELGLAVDRVLGEEDVVIKSMAENFRQVPGIAGASILGDGRVSLILDVEAVIEMASHPTAAQSPETDAVLV